MTYHNRLFLEHFFSWLDTMYLYILLIGRKEARRNGLGERMGAAFLPLARDLGYTASFFNLVFVSNDVRWASQDNHFACLSNVLNV